MANRGVLASILRKKSGRSPLGKNGPYETVGVRDAMGITVAEGTVSRADDSKVLQSGRNGYLEDSEVDVGRE